MQWDVTFYGSSWKGPRPLIYSVNIEAPTAILALSQARAYLFINLSGDELEKLEKANRVEIIQCP